MRLGKSTLAAALATTVVLGASACGSKDDGGSDGFTDKSAEDIKNAAIDDMKDVTSLTMEGTITSDGKEQKLKLSSSTDGTCAGEITVSGGTAQFISGEESFLKGDDAFWNGVAGSPAAAQQILALVGDKWAKVPPGQGGFDSFCDLDNMLEDFTKDDSDGDVKKGDTDDIDGKEAIELTGKTDDGDTSHAWVATEGDHFILKLEAEGSQPGSFTFTDYNEPVDADAPPSEQVVDLSQRG